MVHPAIPPPGSSTKHSQTLPLRPSRQAMTCRTSNGRGWTL
jgi:hypothetical protein